MTNFTIITLSILLFEVTRGKKIGCEPELYDRSKWDCDAYKYHFSTSNLKKTLYCIGFDKMVSPKKALNLTDPLPFVIGRKINKAINLVEETDSVSFEEKFHFKYPDERLRGLY